MGKQSKEEKRYRAKNEDGTSDIVFRLASYNVERLREHRLEASNALEFIAKQVVAANCGSETFARMVQLGLFALDNLNACESLCRAAVEWADVGTCETENWETEKRLVDAMEHLDACAERFRAHCENF